MLFGTEFLTAKGNLRKEVEVKAKADALARINLPLEATPNGTHAMVIGEDADGNKFYLTVSIVVGKANPFEKHEKKVKPKAESDIPEFSIFD